MIDRYTHTLPSDVPGLTSNEVLAFLYDAVIWKKPQHCLEIGPWMGRSTVAICDALAALGGERTLTSVDFFVQAYSPLYLERRTMRLALQRCGPEIDAIYRDFGRLKTVEDCFNFTRERHPSTKGRSKLIKSYAADVDLSGTPMLDFVFIDADSTYNGTRTNLLVSMTKMNPGCVLIIDGYGMDRFMGLWQFVDEIRATEFVGDLGSEGVDIGLEIKDPVALHQFINALQPRAEEHAE